LNPRKPNKPDPFKGKKKVIPIRPPEKKLSFEEKVEKFGRYMHDPKQHGKIFTELGFTFVDDSCLGDCETCEKKALCTVYESINKFEMSRKKKDAKIIPFKKETKTAQDIKIARLIRMREQVAKGEFFLITRLTALKSMFETKPQVDDFALYIAGKTLLRIGKTKPKYFDNWANDKKLIRLAGTTLKKYLAKPRQASTAQLRDILLKLEKIQGWGKNPYWSGPMRIIKNRYALILEDAVRCVLEKVMNGRTIYDIAADYVLAFSDGFQREITKKSLPYLDDIIEYLRKQQQSRQINTSRRKG
jgi:hypothetical protein